MSTNDEQRRYWNDQAGPAWAAEADAIDRMLAPLGRAAMQGVVAEGMSVLDVGCGSGGTTLELAALVGSTGRVIGLDVSQPMLAVARSRAVPSHVTFVHGDAQSEDFDATFDLVFSRVGVMFFSDPDAAFSNLVSALRPGGHLSVATWQRAERNAWLAEVQAIVATYDPPEDPPEQPPQPDGPGAFGLADPARLKDLLSDAGLVDVTVEPTSPMLCIGQVASTGRGPSTGSPSTGSPSTGSPSTESTVESAVNMAWVHMRIDERLADCNAEAAPALRAQLHAFYAQHLTPDGVQLPGAGWISRGRRAK